MSRPLIAAVVALALAGSTPAAPAPRPAGKPIDVVICLDVSSSMNGLIDSAKMRLWDIVNDLGRARPAPNLRVGLYSYGHTRYDARAGWVRKEVDLTNDLDSVYEKLNALTINGGTEYVGRVCRDAIDQQKWAKGKDVLKIIFVCGNEPATQDPLVKLPDLAGLAKKHDIVINAIYCGSAANRDSESWKELAKLAGGRFASIDQNRGTLAVATPVDKELAELSGKLNTTYVAYGKDGAVYYLRQKTQDLAARKAGGHAAASRGVAKGGAMYRNERWDLVDRLKRDPKFDVKKVPEGELSAEMKKMTPAQREKHVKEMLVKRDQIQKKIAALSAKRAEFLREHAKKNPSKADQVFDEAVRATLRDQAAAKGIVIPKDH